MTDELTRIPSRSELKSHLARYFAGTVPDEKVDGLIASVTALLADEPRRRGQVRLFAPDNPVAWGEAWREELVGVRSQPTPLEHALMLAATSKEFPRALPFCPPDMVGSWAMSAREDGRPPAEPRPRWQLSADGSMRAAGYFDEMNRWRVHRGGEGLDRLWLSTDGSAARTTLVIAGVSGDQMELMSSSVTGKSLVFRRA